LLTIPDTGLNRFFVPVRYQQAETTTFLRCTNQNTPLLVVPNLDPLDIFEPGHAHGKVLERFIVGDPKTGDKTRNVNVLYLAQIFIQMVLFLPVQEPSIGGGKQDRNSQQADQGLQEKLSGQLALQHDIETAHVEHVEQVRLGGTLTTWDIPQISKITLFRRLTRSLNKHQERPLYFNGYFYSATLIYIL